VASIIGGAVGRAIMGFISDHSNIRVAFVVPLIWQAYGLSFALRGRQPVLATQPPLAELSTTP
jgi:fucose permease